MIVPKFHKDVQNNVHVDEKLRKLLKDNKKPSISHLYDDYQKETIFHPFSRRLTTSKMPYVERPLEFKKTCHWGQLKLLLTEIEFLNITINIDKNTDKKTRQICIYPGAAPGDHIPHLEKLFPNIIFHLYDSTPFSIKETPQIHIHNQLMTDELALSLHNVYKDDFLIFISDIRNLPAIDSIVEKDMIKQLSWYNILKPNISSFKFRLPYTKGTITYPEGEIYTQCFIGPSSTESRLFVKKNAKMIKYDNKEYEERMMFHNNKIRSTSYENFLGKDLTLSTHELDHCYDCTCMTHILTIYYCSLNKIDKKTLNDTDKSNIHTMILDAQSAISNNKCLLKDKTEQSLSKVLSKIYIKLCDKYGEKKLDSYNITRISARSYNNYNTIISDIKKLKTIQRKKHYNNIDTDDSTNMSNDKFLENLFSDDNNVNEIIGGNVDNEDNEDNLNKISNKMSNKISSIYEFQSYDVKSLPIIDYQFNDVEKELSKTKDLLESIFDNPKKKNLWGKYDLFAKEKYYIPYMSNTYNISNAMLKCLEILNYYKLMVNEKSNNINHFDNASFPGSFIVAMDYYCNQHHLEYNFHACSWVENSHDFKKSNALGDQYKLCKYNPENYLMSEHNNGDITKKDNIMDFVKLLGGSINMYTSDVGMSVDDFKQEETQLKANIGQILSGLLTLKQGGNFITKQYTFFTSKLQKVMTITSKYFEKFYISKPMTSRPTNSEFYLIGLNFNAQAYVGNHDIDELFKMLESDYETNMQVFDFNDILDISSKKQITAINNVLTKIDDNINNNTLVDLSEYDEILHQWYRNNPIIPIMSKLKMDDYYKQKKF